MRSKILAETHHKIAEPVPEATPIQVKSAIVNDIIIMVITKIPKRLCKALLSTIAKSPILVRY